MSDLLDHPRFDLSVGQVRLVVERLYNWELAEVGHKLIVKRLSSTGRMVLIVWSDGSQQWTDCQDVAVMTVALET